MVHLNENNNLVDVDSIIENKKEGIEAAIENKNQENTNTKSSPDLFDLDNIPIFFEDVNKYYI